MAACFKSEKLRFRRNNVTYSKNVTYIYGRKETCFADGWLYFVPRNVLAILPLLPNIRRISENALNLES